jgi:hypothetical protein
MRVRVLVALALACSGFACTPLRSKLPPPYVIDGTSYSAETLEIYANEHCAAGAQPLPPNKFTTDGCSAYPEGKYQECCIKHDVAYWCGARARRDVDQEFRRCVRDASSPTNANLMWTGVRAGGGRFVPFAWRFGYGHPWPHRKIVPSESTPQTPPTSP